MQQVDLRKVLFHFPMKKVRFLEFSILKVFQCSSMYQRLRRWFRVAPMSILAHHWILLPRNIHGHRKRPPHEPPHCHVQVSPFMSRSHQVVSHLMSCQKGYQSMSNQFRSGEGNTQCSNARPIPRHWVECRINSPSLAQFVSSNIKL